MKRLELVFRFRSAVPAATIHLGFAPGLSTPLCSVCIDNRARLTGFFCVLLFLRRERAPIVEGVWSFSLRAQHYFCGYFSAPTCHQHHIDFQVTWEGHRKSVSNSFGLDSENQIEEF